MYLSGTPSTRRASRAPPAATTAAKHSRDQHPRDHWHNQLQIKVGGCIHACQDRLISRKVTRGTGGRAGLPCWTGWAPQVLFYCLEFIQRVEAFLIAVQYT